jgi:thiaminase
MSFTQSLLESNVPAFHAATRAPFLQAAGQGRISRRSLSQWVSQDRIYAQAYIGFTGCLLAKVKLPHHFVHDHKESLEWSIMDMLFGALGYIHRELRFFAETAARYGLHLEYPSRPGESFGATKATRDYIELFDSIADPRKTLLDGMLLLWATERCYLEAWKYSKGQRPRISASFDDADGGALNDAFIPNWTSPELEKFVADIAKYTDELARREGASANDPRHYEMWHRVLEVEKEFWPTLPM